MKKTFIIISMLLLFAVSCSDDVTAPAEVFNYRDYMPLESSNFWQYDYFGINDKREHFLSRFAFDSTAVLDSAFNNGRSAIRLHKVVNNQGVVSESEVYYSLDSSQISIIGLELKIDAALILTNSDWITLYDLYKNDWQNTGIEVKNKIVGQSIYNGTIAFWGSNQGNSKIEFKGNLISTIDTKLNITYNFFKTTDGKTDTIRHNEAYTFRFAKGIGIAYSKYLDYEQDSVLIGGYERVITDYK